MNSGEKFVCFMIGALLIFGHIYDFKILFTIAGGMCLGTACAQALSMRIEYKINMAKLKQLMEED